MGFWYEKTGLHCNSRHIVLLFGVFAFLKSMSLVRSVRRTPFFVSVGAKGVTGLRSGSEVTPPLL